MATLGRIGALSAVDRPNVVTVVGDGEPAGWPRHRRLRTDGVEESRDSKGQSAGESQDGVTCRFRAAESRPPMAG